MRRIGTISDRADAERFRDYLLTQDVKSNIDQNGQEWAVWVYDEDQVDQARGELETYQQSPSDPRYLQSVAEADRLRHERAREAIKAAKKQVNLSRRWQRPLISQIPVTFLLVVLSVVITIGTSFGEKMDTAFGGKLPIVEINRISSTQIAYLPGLEEVRSGELWRLITPAFIHMSAWHLMFNMYWTALFGGLIESRSSSRTLLLLFLWTAAVSNLAEYLATGPMFGGMSGVGYGLFGYIWIKGRLDPEADLFMPQHLVIMFLIWLVICTTGAVGPVANYAHAFGLLSGGVAALVSIGWKRLKAVA